MPGKGERTQGRRLPPQAGTSWTWTHAHLHTDACVFHRLHTQSDSGDRLYRRAHGHHVEQRGFAAAQTGGLKSTPRRPRRWRRAAHLFSIPTNTSSSFFTLNSLPSTPPIATVVGCGLCVVCQSLSPRLSAYSTSSYYRSTAGRSTRILRRSLVL